LPKRIKKIYRLPENLVKDILDDFSQRGFDSENTYAIEAFEHFLKCRKVELSQSMKLIVTKYKGHCLKCKDEIPVASWALYGRGIGLICLDCYVERIGDKTLVAKYLKNRELKKVSKALQVECDRLANVIDEHKQKINIYKVGEKHQELEEYQNTTMQLLNDFLKNKIGTDKEAEAFEEIKRRNQQVEQYLRDIEALIQKSLFKPIEKKKKHTRKEEVS